MTHHLTHPALTKAFTVDVIGAGGNGSQMLTCLARLAHAMRGLGHPGFTVAVHDHDTASPANVGRQMFSPADVGLPKAHVLVHRINAFFGLGWRAHQQRFGGLSWGETEHGHADLTIACVDSRASRRAVRQALQAPGLRYLLDLGNRASDGQALLGQVGKRKAGGPVSSGHVDLPDPYTLLPELVDGTGPEDDAPSCSLAEALERQELFVNDDVTRAGAQILWNLVRRGRVEWHGAFVNSLTGRRAPVPVDPRVWATMGSAKLRKEK